MDTALALDGSNVSAMGSPYIGVDYCSGYAARVPIQGENCAGDASDSEQEDLPTLPPLPAVVAVFSDTKLPPLMEQENRAAAELSTDWSVDALR